MLWTFIFRAFENDDEDLNNSGEGSTPETPVVPVHVPGQGSNTPGNLKFNKVYAELIF